MLNDRELPIYPDPESASDCSCPACSSAGKRPLQRCVGCDWTDAAGVQQARRRLSRFHHGAGQRAYVVGGCQVCSACATQFFRHPTLCPLRIFYLGLGLWSLSRILSPPGNALARLHGFLHACLKDRGYPEEVESYWKRLFAWLEAEARRSDWHPK